MSYILDALNKSNKEQNPQAVPSINIHHSNSAQPAKISKTLRYLTVFVFLLLANAASVYIWLSIDTNDAANPLSGADTFGIAPENISEKTSSFENRPVSAALIPLNSLPVSMQEKVGALNFSSHIYSEHPDLRAVNIDGSTFHESEMITAELKLEQVTTNGVVLNYLKHRFAVNIVADW